MTSYYALVDAVPGREAEVEKALQARPDLKGVARCKEGSHDFLIGFEAPAFSFVDDFLQTHVRRVPGVKGVEVIRDFDDYSRFVREAKELVDRLKK